jgi:hypothetical protein
MIYRVNSNGLNIPSYQVSYEPQNVKHEYITVPPAIMRGNLILMLLHALLFKLD